MFNLTAVFFKRFKIKKVKLYDYYVGIHASLLMLINTSDPYSTCSHASIHCSPTPPLYTQTHYLHKQFIQCKNSFATIKVVRYPKNFIEKIVVGNFIKRLRYVSNSHDRMNRFPFIPI